MDCQICCLGAKTRFFRRMFRGKWRPSLWRSLHVCHAGVITNQMGLNVGTLIWVGNRNSFKCKCIFFFLNVTPYLRYHQGSRLTGLFCFLYAWLNAKCVLVLVSVFLTHIGSGYLRVLHRGWIFSGKNRYKCVKPHLLGYTLSFSAGQRFYEKHKGLQCDWHLSLETELKPILTEGKFTLENCKNMHYDYISWLY